LVKLGASLTGLTVMVTVLAALVRAGDVPTPSGSPRSVTV
jgi:hypothetical protein